MGKFALLVVYCPYFWSLMSSAVLMFVRSCSTCDFSRTPETTNQTFSIAKCLILSVQLGLGHPPLYTKENFSVSCDSVSRKIFTTKVRIFIGVRGPLDLGGGGGRGGR